MHRESYYTILIYQPLAEKGPQDSCKGLNSLILQGSAQDIYFNQLEPFGASGAFYSKENKNKNQENSWKYLRTAKQPGRYQTTSSLFSWYDFNRGVISCLWKQYHYHLFQLCLPVQWFNILHVSKSTDLISFHSGVIYFIVGGLSVVAVSFFLLSFHCAN